MRIEPPQGWLQPGQPQQIWMERDSHVLVERGSVSITLPPNGWLGFGPQATVTAPAGSAQLVRRAGWVRLEAAGRRAAEVRLIAPLAANAGGHRHLWPAWVARRRSTG